MGKAQRTGFGPTNVADIDPDAVTGVCAAADGLRRLVLTMEQVRHHLGSIAGVGDTDLMAIGNLDTHGPMSAGELSNRLGISRSSVTALVDRLEEAKLVTRQPDPDDRRRLSLVITGAGQAALAKVRSYSLLALESIDPDRLPALVEALDELVVALDRQHAGMAADG